MSAHNQFVLELNPSRALLILRLLLFATDVSITSCDLLLFLC